MDRRKAIKGLGLSLGYVVSAPTVISMLQSCQEKKESWAGLFFDENEVKVVPYLVDIILPASQTPGGLDLNLPQFIDMMCQDTLTESDSQLFHKGSQIFGIRFKEKFNKEISKAGKEEVEQLFSTYFELEEEQANHVKLMQSAGMDELEGQDKDDYFIYKFLLTVRSLSLLGYFTSEKIGKEVLIFDPIPGMYKPCIPVTEVGNAWTI